jgi:hypothetical protein
MRPRFLFAVLLVASAAGAQVATCPGSGLSVMGGRLGDPWSIALTGPPGAAGVLASDASGGPVATPFGTVCLGLTPSLVTTPLTLDATGNFAMSGVLPVASPIPVGSTLFTQAALAHPTLPGGYSITNGAAVAIRSPALFVFRSGLTPLLDRIDAKTDTITFSVALPGQAGSILRIPRLGWIAFRIGTSVICIDDLTGATVLTVPGAFNTNESPVGSMAVSDDGSYLFVSTFGSTWTGSGFSVLASVRTYSLPSGALVGAPAVFPFASCCNRGLYHVPGSTIVYVVATDRIYVVNGVTGVLITTLILPGSLAGSKDFAFASPGRMWVVVAGSLYGIDTASHTQVAGPALLGAGSIVPLAIGPGPTGPSLWAIESFGLGGSAIIHASLITLVPQTAGTLITSLFAPEAALSAGGTGMIVLSSGSGGSTANLFDVNVTTGAIAPVASGIVDLEILRSGSLTKAYVYGSAGLVSIPTDPTLGPGTVIPLPNTYVSTVRLLSN